jgi:cystathionine beta-lyase/cystathionine gamma-synthase
MVAVDLGSEAAARAFLDALRYFAQGVSLGDADSLATRPYSTTHQLLPEDQRRAMGVTPGLVRLSVGLEDPEDLIEDLKAGLRAAQAASAPA